MKISLFTNIFETLTRSIAFNSLCIIIFGIIYILLANRRQRQHLDNYFILSAKTQFLIPSNESAYNPIEKDVILIQKVIVVIGLALISIHFFIRLF